MDLPAIQILEALDRHAVDAPQRIAVREVGCGRTVTYAQLAGLVAEEARAIRDHASCGIAIFITRRNTADFHVAFLAALRAGCSVFPFSPDATETEKQAASDLNREIAEQSLLLQTSGTTGRPAIVVRPAGAINAVCSNMVEAIGIRRTDQVLSSMPLCHSYGLEHGLLAPITAGATVHLMDKFNLASALRELMGSGITVFPAVPSIFEMLANLADDGARFPALRAAYSAGSVLPTRVAEVCASKLNLKIGQVYGATEVGSITYNDPTWAGYDPASAGLPMRGVQLKTLTTSGVVALAETEGRLHVHAPSQMSGYLTGDGSEISDGFFSTGDVARLSPDGRLTITGRTKLLIDIGGLKVNPIEVEQLLLDHPLVGECVVIPVSLSETVNRLKAVIIPRQAHLPPAPDELSRFARARLTAYKVPRVFEIRSSLPRTATGKVLRHLVEA